MSAAIGCSNHPAGSVEECGPCGQARHERERCFHAERAQGRGGSESGWRDLLDENEQRLGRAYVEQLESQARLLRLLRSIGDTQVLLQNKIASIEELLDTRLPRPVYMDGNLRDSANLKGESSSGRDVKDSHIAGMRVSDREVRRLPRVDHQSEDSEEGGRIVSIPADDGTTVDRDATCQCSSPVRSDSGAATPVSLALTVQEAADTTCSRDGGAGPTHGPAESSPIQGAS